MTVGLHQLIVRIGDCFWIGQIDQMSKIFHELRSVSRGKSLYVSQQVSLDFIPNNVRQH